MEAFCCETCNLNYKTHSGLWKHNNKKHNINKEIIEYNCNICNKKFNSRQSRWIHQKKCNDNELIIIKNEYKQLKDEIAELKNNNTNIINNSNNNSNNITDNRKQIIINYSPGTEPITHFFNKVMITKIIYSPERTYNIVPFRNYIIDFFLVNFKI